MRLNPHTALCYMINVVIAIAVCGAAAAVAVAL